MASQPHRLSRTASNHQHVGPILNQSTWADNRLLSILVDQAQACRCYVEAGHIQLPSSESLLTVRLLLPVEAHLRQCTFRTITRLLLHMGKIFWIMGACRAHLVGMSQSEPTQRTAVNSITMVEHHWMGLEQTAEGQDIRLSASSTGDIMMRREKG